VHLGNVRQDHKQDGIEDGKVVFKKAEKAEPAAV